MIKIKIKLTLMQTVGLVVAAVVLYMGGWILTLIICAIVASTMSGVTTEDAFIDIDTTRSGDS